MEGKRSRVVVIFEILAILAKAMEENIAQLDVK